MISVAASAKIVEPVDDKRRWVFKTPQNDALMAGALADAMSSQGQDAGLHRLRRRLRRRLAGRDAEGRQGQGIEIVSIEKYSRTDTSVTGRVLKLVGAKPDAILIAGAGTPSALPQKELRARNYGGVIYQTHGAANNDVLRVCGKDCDGMFLPAGPLLVAAQLPDSNPVKKSALAYVETYEKAHGAGSTNTFGGHMWDAGQLVVAALPAALKTGAKPGTPEFRVAMRDALESIKDLPASQGVFNMSPTDHAGFDERSRVIVKVEGGSGCTSRACKARLACSQGARKRRRAMTRRSFRPARRIGVPGAAGTPKQSQGSCSMDSSIALILLQDGVVNGAIYALLGMALVLVFAVTRVIFIPRASSWRSAR